VDKIRENKLRSFGHDVMRREETEAVRVFMKINVEGKIGRGRLKKKRLDLIVNDMRCAGLLSRGCEILTLVDV